MSDVTWVTVSANKKAILCKKTVTDARKRSVVERDSSKKYFARMVQFEREGQRQTACDEANLYA